MLFSLLLIVGGLGAASCVASPKSKSTKTLKPWTAYARRLYGESNRVLEESIEGLKSTKNLDKLLLESIETGKNRELAFDVIATLKKYDFMKVLVKESRRDQTGVVYRTMNALTTKSNRKLLINLYKLRLNGAPMSFPARIVIVDTLGRLRFKIKDSLLTEWMQKGNFELQSAVLNYLRRVKSSFRNDEIKDLLHKGLSSGYYQTRLQVLYDFPYYLLDFSLCKNDPNKEVKDKCKEKSKSKEVDW